MLNVIKKEEKPIKEKNSLKFGLKINIYNGI